MFCCCLLLLSPHQSISKKVGFGFFFLFAVAVNTGLVVLTCGVLALLREAVLGSSLSYSGLVAVSGQALII